MFMPVVGLTARHWWGLPTQWMCPHGLEYRLPFRPLNTDLSLTPVYVDVALPRRVTLMLSPMMFSEQCMPPAL